MLTLPYLVLATVLVLNFVTASPTSFTEGQNLKAHRRALVAPAHPHNVVYPASSPSESQLNGSPYARKDPKYSGQLTSESYPTNIFHNHYHEAFPPKKRWVKDEKGRYTPFLPESPLEFLPSPGRDMEESHLLRDINDEPLINETEKNDHHQKEPKKVDKKNPESFTS